MGMRVDHSIATEEEIDEEYRDDFSVFSVFLCISIQKIICAIHHKMGNLASQTAPKLLNSKIMKIVWQ